MAKLLLLSLLLCACSSRSDEATLAGKRPTLFDSIQGIWWADTNAPSAAFWIHGDTMTNVDHASSHPIKLVGDSLTILYEDDPWTNHVSMLGPDTLLMTGGSYSEAPHKYFKMPEEE